MDSILEPPYSHRNAYMLFYMRDSGSLETAVAQATATSPEGPSRSLSSIGKKRAREDDNIEEDMGRPVRHALSSNGAGPSSIAVSRKVGGMLPKQDRPPQVLHTTKPSLARPPHNRLPDSEDEKEEAKSPHFHKKAKLDVGVAFNSERDRAKGKKKQKKLQGDIVKLSSLSLSGEQPSLDLPNVSSDHEEEELETFDLANKAVIYSSPPLPPGTSSPAAMPSPSKKRKLVDYSSGGDDGPTDSDDAGDNCDATTSKPASSPASSASASASGFASSPLPGPERQGREDATIMLSERVPENSMFPQPSLATPQQRQQWNGSYKPKKPKKYSSQRKQEDRRRKGFGNPYAYVGY